MSELSPALLRLIDALAALRARIEALGAKWGDAHENRNYSTPFRMGLLKAADELDRLLADEGGVA